MQRPEPPRAYHLTRRVGQQGTVPSCGFVCVELCIAVHVTMAVYRRALGMQFVFERSCESERSMDSKHRIWFQASNRMQVVISVGMWESRRECAVHRPPKGKHHPQDLCRMLWPHSYRRSNICGLTFVKRRLNTTPNRLRLVSTVHDHGDLVTNV